MNIIFCVDATLDKTNCEETIYQDLLYEQVDEFKKNQLDHALEELREEEKDFALPVLLKVIKITCFFLSLIIFGGVVSSLGDVTIGQAFENAPYFFYGFPLVFMVWLLIFLYEKNKLNKGTSDQSLQNKNRVTNALVKDIFENFNVPATAKKMDVLGFKYIEREGTIKILPIGILTYINTEKRVFLNNETLYLADIDKVIAIPLNAIENIQKVKKKAVVNTWNKDIPFNRKPYKSYKIRANQFGQLFIHYGIMNINYKGVKYYLYLPDYEIDVLKEMVDLKVINF